MRAELHTPGPWDADALGVNADGRGNGPWRAVATVHVGREGGGSKAVQPAEAEANARLIAAAPAMYDAIRSFVRDRATCPTANGADLEAWEKMRAALAVAEQS